MIRTNTDQPRPRFHPAFWPTSFASGSAVAFDLDTSAEFIDVTVSIAVDAAAEGAVVRVPTLRDSKNAFVPQSIGAVIHLPREVEIKYRVLVNGLQRTATPNCDNVSWRSRLGVSVGTCAIDHGLGSRQSNVLRHFCTQRYRIL
jgi:hypothetical protein